MPLALPLLGFAPALIPQLRKHVDNTSDVQLGALLGAYIPLSACSAGDKAELRRWREAYRGLLDGWGMWGERVGYDQGWMRAGRELGPVEEAERRDGSGGESCPV